MAIIQKIDGIDNLHAKSSARLLVSELVLVLRDVLEALLDLGVLKDPLLALGPLGGVGVGTEVVLVRRCLVELVLLGVEVAAKEALPPNLVVVGD